MSINWQIRDLASVLRTTVILAKELRIGDVVVEDHGVWQVAKIGRLKSSPPSQNILDIDDNGGPIPDDHLVRIVARDALRNQPRAKAKKKLIGAWR